MVFDMILRIINLLRAWFNPTPNLTVFELEDNDSIVSFSTACEEIVAPDDRASVPAPTAQNTCPGRRTPKVVSRSCWYELDEYFDENPGAEVDPAVIEDHDIVLPFSSVFLHKWRSHVEAFSGASISISPSDSPAQHVFRLRLTGTHLSAMYAFQAYNIIAIRHVIRSYQNGLGHLTTEWALDGRWRTGTEKAIAQVSV
ncbi:hypothetical protein BJV82DRAFT_580740 [Fennellomyces sp. T-0311]|nr:hypothetical protein BJV82DRAFT_580740 [Fennellomyces sp. T-0311]